MKKTLSNKEEEMSIVLISGKGSGYFRYGDITREFNEELYAMVSRHGGLIVMSGGTKEKPSIKPICYIEQGADIAMVRNGASFACEISAIADDGREILVQFTTVKEMQLAKKN